MMTREQREKANRLVETLLDIAPEQRKSMLESIVGGLGEDALVIRAEVERLLEEDDSVVSRLASLAPATDAVTREKTVGANASAGEPQERVPSVIGRYHLRGPLGGGGMGVVYLAEQRAPIVRTVAIKLIRAGFDTHEVLARFEAERQALARMDHAHIARVFDAGITEAGRPYFVMEYVPGRALTEFADKERLSINARLELFAQVCDAISHAHMKGVIHRDLKPSNVLAFNGEDGKPIVKVIDFGIAKAMTPGDRLGLTTHYTQPNLVLGTYEYMSPEQAAGLGDIDTRSDVYSLGVLLYELIGGVRPFERDDLATHTDEELRRVIRDVEAPRPSTRLLTLLRPRTVIASKTNAGTSIDREASARQIAEARRSNPRELAKMLQRELEWIPLMAMRKERTRRYRGATELAADVRNWLAGKPLVAAPESKVYRTRKFVVAHRRAIIAIAAALLLLVAGVIGTSVGLVRESRARQLADANGQLASRGAYRSAIAAADVALRSGDGVSLRWALDSAPPALRGWEWNWLRRSGTGTTVDLKRTAGERYERTIALSDNRRAWTQLSTRDTWLLWNLTTGEPIRRERGTDLNSSPDGKLCVIVRPNGALDAVETDTGAMRWHLDPASPSAVWRLSSNPFSQSGRSIVAWDGGTAFTIVDVATGTPRSLPTGAQPDHAYGFLDFNDGTDAVENGFVFRQQDALVARSIHIQTGVVTQPPHFDYFLDRRTLNNASVNQLRTVGMEPATYNIPQREQKRIMVLLPKHGAIATGQDNGSVLLHPLQPLVTNGDTASQAAVPARRLIVGETPATWIAATPDESTLIATTTDGGVHACPLDQPENIAGAMTGARASTLSPDGSRVAAVSWGNIQCFDVTTGLPVWGRNLGPYDNRYLAWSPDGSTVVVASGPLPLEENAPADTVPDSEVFVLDAKTGAQKAAFSSSAVTVDPVHPPKPPPWASGARGVAFSADGKRLIVSRLGAAPAVVDVATWQTNDLPVPTTNPVGGLLNDRGSSPGLLLPSPSGKRIAELQGGSLDFIPRIAGGITLRDAQTLLPLRTFAFDNAAATTVTWSRDEKTLLAGFIRAGDSFVVAFNAADGRERYRVATPDGEPIPAITTTADGSRVLAFTRSRRMMVIDAVSGTELLLSSTDRLVSAAFVTSDEALVLSDDANAFVRYESQSADRSLAAMQARWPEGLDKPATVSAARHASFKAMTTLVEAYRRGEDPADAATAARLEPEAAARPLLIACAGRMPPNINWLNSGALSISLADHPSHDVLCQAAAMLRMAVAIKPQSGVLQNNLGTTLFRLEDYTAARRPFREATRIRATYGYKPNPFTALSLAIAAQRCGDADSDALFDQAVSLAHGEEIESDPEGKTLVERLHREFGR